MMVLSAEGELFNIMAGRYSGGNSNFGVFLKGHNGDPLRIDRRGRVEIVRSPRLTLALAVQPDVLRFAAARTDFRDRGLLARFLYVLPTTPRIGHREIRPEPADPRSLKAWAEGISTLYYATKMSELRFSAEADFRFAEWEVEIERKLQRDGLMMEIVDWGAKLAGATARIAALLHVAEHRERLDPWPDVIGRASLENAISLAKCFITHSLKVTEMAEDTETARHARRIIHWLRKNKVRACTVRDIAREQGPRLRRVSQLKPILSFLCVEGWLRFDPRTGIYEPHSRVFGDSEDLSGLSDLVRKCCSDPQNRDKPLQAQINDGFCRECRYPWHLFQIMISKP